MRGWLDKWLKLTTKGLPALLQLEVAAYEFCRDYAKHPRHGRRLLITGFNGTGKTHVAKAIHRWALKTAIKLPLVPVDMDGIDHLGLTTSQFLFWPGVVDGFKRGEWDLIEAATNQSLLVLDDIGAEHDPSGIGREKLFYILERREFKWTIFTTNVPQTAWETKFERRIASRFLRNCQTIDLSGVPDYCAE